MSQSSQVDYIASQIRQKNCTPVIGNQLVLDLLFGKKRLFSTGLDFVGELDQSQVSPSLCEQFQKAGKPLTSKAQVRVTSDGNKWTIADGGAEYLVQRENKILNVDNKNVAQAWADEVNYPLADTDNLTRVAQFLNVETGKANWHYLEFLKKRLLLLERQKSGANRTFLDGVEKQADRFSVTQLAISQLHYPNFTKQQDGNPLSILARLDIPVYITTSHHCFLEEALKAIKKTPRSEVYCWREDLNIPAEHAVDLKLEPTVGTPVVFHLFGIDSYDASLVLTEDDHLDFLVGIMRDFSDSTKMPTHLRVAIQKSTVLLLGYEIHEWDLKTFLKGLIENTLKHPDSIAIQIDPANGSQIQISKLLVSTSSATSRR